MICPRCREDDMHESCVSDSLVCDNCSYCTTADFYKKPSFFNRRQKSVLLSVFFPVGYMATVVVVSLIARSYL